MSQAAAAHAVEPAETPLTPESWGKLGMWVFLAGDAMSFGILLAGYAVMRSKSPNWPVPANVLGIGLTAFMTFLLICSSVTMVKGLDAIKRGDPKGLVKFLGMTVLGGLIFLGLQAYEWTHLIHEGLGLTQNKWGAALFGTTFFMITGFHGMHVTGGVIYLSAIAWQGSKGAYSAHRYNAVEIVGLYWHFVDLVWILVFTFVYLL
ncbi:MAG: cytochrome c oxidase subunit 3 [Candidatus Tectomicrobia bacterium]|nr:cytochrome c oxidase subunit 3 [Candidatus Tectomicrobia bacterium]